MAIRFIVNRDVSKKESIYRITKGDHEGPIIDDWMFRTILIELNGPIECMTYMSYVATPHIKFISDYYFNIELYKKLWQLE